MQRAYNAASILPGRCFLCERAFEEGESALNTGWVHSPDWDTKLYGNKMVCDNCAADVATGIRWQSSEDVAHDRAVLTAAWDEEQVALHEEIDRLREQVGEGIDPEALAQRVAELMKPKTTKPRSGANATA